MLKDWWFRHLDKFNRTSVRRRYLFGTILVAVAIVALSSLTAVSSVVTIFNTAQYPFVGNSTHAFSGWKGLALGAVSGSLITLALLYFRLVSNDMFEALTEPWLAGTRRSATFAVIFAAIVWLGTPWVIHCLTTNFGQSTELFRIGAYLALVVDFLQRNTGGIIGLIVSAVSVLAFYITILQLKDFQSRISSFGQLLDRLVDLAESATVHDKLHAICYTPAIGYLAEPKRWSRVKAALTNESADPDGDGNTNRVRMIVPRMEQLERWHGLFLMRRTKRGFSVIQPDDIEGANTISQKIKDILAAQIVADDCTPAYVERDFNLLPGYYCFFTLRRAIIVTPLFVPLEVGSRLPAEAMPSTNLPPPDMIGFMTTDRSVIDSMFDQFEYILNAGSQEPMLGRVEAA